MDIETVIQTIDKLIQELDQLPRSLQTQTPKQWDESLKRWEARAYEEIRNSGLTDAAESFKRSPSSMRMNDYAGNIRRKGEAKKANLTALLEDIKSNKPFYAKKLGFAAGAAATRAQPEAQGTASVFLGHGRSALWAKVQVFLEKDLKLNVQVWEAESREGRHTIAVLNELLDRSDFAVLIMTGEDATPDGEHRARQNVIHEIGLFQGRLGFEKVALLEQDGIEGCSNLLGLQSIRFRDDEIESTFYRLQKMLQREGLLH